jgi:hypothetical protein
MYYYSLSNQEVVILILPESAAADDSGGQAEGNCSKSGRRGIPFQNSRGDFFAGFPGRPGIFNENIKVFNSGQGETDHGERLEFFNPVLLHLAVKGSPGDIEICRGLFEVAVIHLDHSSNQGFFSP